MELVAGSWEFEISVTRGGFEGLLTVLNRFRISVPQNAIFGLSAGDDFPVSDTPCYHPFLPGFGPDLE